MSLPPLQATGTGYKELPRCPAQRQAPWSGRPTMQSRGPASVLWLLPLPLLLALLLGAGECRTWRGHPLQPARGPGTGGAGMVTLAGRLGRGQVSTGPHLGAEISTEDSARGYGGVPAPISFLHSLHCSLGAKTLQGRGEECRPLALPHLPQTLALPDQPP